jgi:hypothetical protein
MCLIRVSQKFTLPDRLPWNVDFSELLRRKENGNLMPNGALDADYGFTDHDFCHIMEK